MNQGRRGIHLHRDSRGLALGIVVFAAMIVMGGMLFFLLFEEGLIPVFDSTSSAAQTQEGADQIALARSIALGMGAYILILSLIFILARSVVESRGPV